MTEIYSCTDQRSKIKLSTGLVPPGGSEGEPIPCLSPRFQRQSWASLGSRQSQPPSLHGRLPSVCLKQPFAFLL